jgi:Glycosyl transferase family 2
VDLDHETTRLCSPGRALAPTDSATEPRVAILLSTFNGGRFLGEQLRSYTAQTHGNWRLYWRDDGSSDDSPALMAAFAGGAGDGRCIRLPKGAQLHATASFLSLLRGALLGDASFFAFSDQDDVWLPEKLAHAVAALEQVPAGRPALYFCGRTLVDSALRPIGQAPVLRRPPGFPAALTQNVIPGCCMILNRAAARLIDAAEAPDRTWHDWWCYLVVSAGDGIVICGDSPDILYRQHDGNLVGEPLRFSRRAAAAIRRGRTPFINLFWRHVIALQARPGLLTDRTCTTLSVIVEAAQGGLFARARALFIPGLVRQTWLETLVFRLWFLLG